MATFTIKPPADVRTNDTGVVKSKIAGGRIPFGAAVIRAGAGTVKAGILEDAGSMLVQGFVLEDEVEHTYPGFYESGEMVPMAIGGTVNALICDVGGGNLVAGDLLELADITSSTNTGELGVLCEAGGSSNAGETRTPNVCARLLEDLTMGSDTYKAPASTPTAGETTISMMAGDMALMGLHVGDWILIRDSDKNGLAGQMNRITAMSDDGSTATMTVLIPITVAAADYIHAVRQAEVAIIL